jgi:hypothetical protein
MKFWNEPDRPQDRLRHGGDSDYAIVWQVLGSL